MVRVEASKLEVYNEKVYDLLKAGGQRAPLKVREGSHGVFVDGLTRVLCKVCACACHMYCMLRAGFIPLAAPSPQTHVHPYLARAVCERERGSP